MSYVDLSEFPKKRKALRGDMFKLFKSIPKDRTLKLEMNDYDITVSGFRYIIKAWNKEHKKEKLEFAVVGARSENPVVYVKCK